MVSPLISILVPVYNCEAYLDECISSIINQDYENLQIVLANDGSTDKSLEICQKYAAKDPRITVLTGPNKGVSTTRNILLDQIKGDYFLFVDADDWIEPDMVGYLVNLIQEYNADIAVCANVTSNSDSTNHDLRTTIKQWNQKETIEKFLYHKEINGSLCNKLIRKSLIKGNKFTTGIYYGEDALFCWGLIQYITNLIVSDKPLYNYRMNPGSLSHTQFGSKKLTANKVWNVISEDADKKYSDLAPIGKARWGMEMTQLLMLAAKNKIKRNNDIKELQAIVKQNFPYMKSFKITSSKGLLYAWLTAHNYTLSLFISKYI